MGNYCITQSKNVNFFGIILQANNAENEKKNNQKKDVADGGAGEPKPAKQNSPVDI